MKKLLILLLFISSTSCIKNDDLYVGEKNVDYLDMFKTVKSGYQDGKTTIVTVEETRDTILVANKQVDFVVPKGYNLKTTYVDKLPYKNGGVSLISQTIVFEDSKAGDYDYNDLVLYLDYKNFYDENGKDIVETNISIIPIALGASKTIGFGYILPDGQDILITRNCRTDLFGNNSGFINTVKSKPKINYIDNKIRMNHKFSIKSNDFRINPYIIVGKDKIFAATSRHHEETEKYKDVIDNNGYPYGIVIYGIFEYPNETSNINLGYPKFDNWINGNSDIFTNQKETKYLYGY